MTPGKTMHAGGWAQRPNTRFRSPARPYDRGAGRVPTKGKFGYNTVIRGRHPAWFRYYRKTKPTGIYDL
jgi:hypothetical protein